MKIVELLRPLREDNGTNQPVASNASNAPPKFAYIHPSGGWGSTASGEVWAQHGGIHDVATGEQLTPTQWSRVPGANYTQSQPPPPVQPQPIPQPPATTLANTQPSPMPPKP